MNWTKPLLFAAIFAVQFFAVSPAYPVNPATLDSSFGSGGAVITSVLGADDVGSAVAVQSDGKIVVAGSSWNGTNYDFALARYSANGTLDTSFNGSGKVTTAIGASDDWVSAVTLQSDGKIVVAGYSKIGTDYLFALARYNANGSLDTGFNGNGKITTAIGATDDKVAAIALQPDGKIVVAGSSWNGTNYDFALARYNANGSLDTTFDADGKVTTAIGTSDDLGSAISLQADGKIVVAGYSKSGTNYLFALARYNTDGSLDTNFDTDGKVTTAIGGIDDKGSAVALQPDGKIVASGYSWNGANYDFALTRYNANGSLDTTFGSSSNGKVATAVGASNDSLGAIVLQPDGKIVVAGFAVISYAYFALARYNANGSLDSAFGSGGLATTDVYLYDDAVQALALQPDGKIVVAGYSYHGSGRYFALARYAGAFNDDFALRRALSGASVAALGSNLGATKEISEPSHGGNAGGKSVWWSWLAPASGQFAITTQGSDFDTLLGVYTGSSVSGLTLIAQNDDESASPVVRTSRVVLDAVSGTTYQIAVDGYSGASGNIALNIASTQDTVPDAFSFASQAGAPFSTLVESNSITVAGIDAPAPISIANGEYRIGAGGAWTAAPGNVTNGQVVTVRLTSASTAGTVATATLNIGGITASFAVTTGAGAPAPVLSLSATSLAFGTQAVAGTSQPMTIALQNSGSAPLNLSVTLAGEFGFSHNCGTAVATGASCVFNVVFSPLGAGARSGSISITSDAAGSPHVVNLGGTGAVPDTAPEAFVSQFAYIANRTGNTVSVIDTAANAVAATIAVGKSPRGIAATPNSSRVYVTNSESFTVSVIDTRSNLVVATIPVEPYPIGVAINPAGTRVYVGGSNYNFGGQVSVIDSATNSVVATVPVGNFDPAALAVTPDGARVYVSGSSGGSVINAADYSITQLAVLGGIFDGSIALNPAGTRLYVADSSNTLSVIDTANNSLAATITLGYSPDGVAVSPDGGRVYVTHSSADKVSVIDASNDNILSVIAAGDGPKGIAVNPAGTRVYVANENANSVSIIDSSNNTVISTVPVGAGPASYGYFLVQLATGFVPQSGVAPNTQVTSNEITVAGINTATAISLDRGEYSVNGGAFTNAGATVVNDDRIKLRQSADATAATTTAATLTVGTVPVPFYVTTAPADAIPNMFSFGYTFHRSVALGAVMLSDAISVSGLSAPTARISIVGGEYSVNGGAWTSAPGTVQNNDKVVIRHIAASENGKITKTMLTIGGISSQFITTTVPSGQTPIVDTSPEAFSFTPQAGVAASTLVVSNVITVQGIPDFLTSVSITGGEYSIDDGAYTAIDGGIRSGGAGGTIKVRVTSAPTPGTPVTARLTIGDQIADFVVTTAGAALVSLAVSGTGSVNEAATASYTASATFSDSSTSAVAASWSVTAPASIDTSGVLTAGSVSANTQVTVTAAYGGLSATKTVTIFDVAPVVTAPALTFAAKTATVGQTGQSMTAISNSTGIITYSSSNTAIATIDATTGALTLITAGTSTVTASQAAAGNFSAASTTATLTVGAAATAPGAPTSVSASPGNAQATVSFSGPTSNGGVAITSYTATSSPGGYTASGSTSPITVTGLANGTAYTFTVAATNSVGTGAASAPSNSVTPSTNPTFTPALVSGFNLMGNTLNTSLDVMTVFGNQTSPVSDITDNIASVWKWDAGNGKWQFHSPLLSTAANATYASAHDYDVLTSIAAGEGYWVNALTAMNLLPQTGEAFNWNNMNFANLTSGFNLIAHAGNVTPSQFNTDVSATALGSGVVATDNFSTLWAWDASNSTWFFYSPLLESAGGLAAVKTYADSHSFQHFHDPQFNKKIDIGVGFWVNKF